MPTKISELPVATIVTGANLIPLVQVGVTKQATLTVLGAGLPYLPAGTGAVATTVQGKLQDSVSVEDFGASTSNIAIQNNVPIQDALNHLRDHGGKLTFSKGGTYLVSVQLTLQRSSVLHAKRWVIEGNNSIIQSSLSSGALIIVGATTTEFFVEDGGTTIRDLFIVGEETISGKSGNPTHDQTGLYLYITGNVLLENVQVLKCKTGIRTHFCFPLKAISVSCRGCWVGLHCDETSNLQDWDGLATPDCRYGVLIKATTTSFSSGKISNLTFRKWWLEGCQVGMTVDSGSGAGVVLIRSINVIEPWIASIEYDVMRLGLVYTFTTPEVRGAQCNDFVFDCRFLDGLWNNTPSATSSSFVFATDKRVRQCYIDVPIALITVDANSWVGVPSGGIIISRGRPDTVEAGRTTRYFYDQDGALTQIENHLGDIEFFGVAGLRVPAVTYTATATGMSDVVAPTGVVGFVRVGDSVTMDIPAIAGTSDSVFFTLSEGPVAMRPTADRVAYIRVHDNGATRVLGMVVIKTTGVLEVTIGAEGDNFTNIGSKGTASSSISYII